MRAIMVWSRANWGKVLHQQVLSMAQAIMVVLRLGWSFSMAQGQFLIEEWWSEVKGESNQGLVFLGNGL